MLLAESKINTTKAQQQLYALMTNLRNALSNNPRFPIPITGSDPVFSRSIVNEVPWDSKTKGQLITSVTFTIIATVGDGLVINIPGIGDIDAISDSADDGRNNTQVSNDEGNTKRSKGAFVGVRFIEYEYTLTKYNSIEALIVADNPLSITFKYPLGNEIYKAKLEYQRQTKRFNGIRTVFLQINRETV